MKAPGIISGIVFAIGASMIGSLLHTLLPLVVTTTASLMVTLALMSVAYLAFLLKKGRQKTGRITIFVGWTLISGVGFFLNLPIFYFILSQAALIWIVRSLVFQRSILSSLLDLALITIGLLAAIWALLQTGSIAATLWSFFLVQSLFAHVPHLKRAKENYSSASEDPFQSAYRAATEAIQKLTTH